MNDRLRQQLDSLNIYDVIEELPNQFVSGFQETTVTLSPDTAKIVFCGMGGSALPANLLKTYLSLAQPSFHLPIRIVRDYALPSNIDESYCGFFSSYSGNTEEILSLLAQAEKKGLKQIIILAHSGKLLDLAKQKNYPLITIPDTKQPRLSYGYYVGALLKVLVNSQLLKLNDDLLVTDIGNITSQTNNIKTQAEGLAGRIKDHIPLIYSSSLWQSLAMVWKINLNENAKTPSFWNAFPEMNHNELVGFTQNLGQFKAILLQDPDQNEKITKRLAVFQKMFQSKLKAEIIDLPAGSPFYKLIYGLMLGVWTSYFLALEYNLDPGPVDLVEEFKTMMKD